MVVVGAVDEENLYRTVKLTEIANRMDAVSDGL